MKPRDLAVLVAGAVGAAVVSNLLRAQLIDRLGFLQQIPEAVDAATLAVFVLGAGSTVGPLRQGMIGGAVVSGLALSDAVLNRLGYDLI